MAVDPGPGLEFRSESGFGSRPPARHVHTRGDADGPTHDRTKRRCAPVGCGRFDRRSRCTRSRCSSRASMPRPGASAMPKARDNLTAARAGQPAAFASNRESRLAPPAGCPVHVHRSARSRPRLTPPRPSRRIGTMLPSPRPSTGLGARPPGRPLRPSRRSSGSSRRRAILLAITASVLATACLSGGSGSGTGDDLDASALEEARLRRIAALEAEIARDRGRLADLVADPTVEDERALHENPTLRELAARIIERSQELERLQAGGD